MQRFLISFIVILLGACVNTQNNNMNNRIIEESTSISMTWAIVSILDDLNWIFIFEDATSLKEYEIFSKNHDLKNFQTWAIILKISEWKIGNIFIMKIGLPS